MRHDLCERARIMRSSEAHHEAVNLRRRRRGAASSSTSSRAIAPEAPLESARPRFARADGVRVRGRGPLRACASPRSASTRARPASRSSDLCDAARRGDRAQAAPMPSAALDGRGADRRHRRRRRQPARRPTRGLRCRAVRRRARRSEPVRPATARHRAAARVPVARCRLRRRDACVAPSRVPLDRGTAMALQAAEAAMRAAGLEPGSFDPERLGIFWGSGMAGAATFERDLPRRLRRCAGGCGRPASSRRCRTRRWPSSRCAWARAARPSAYACACASSAVAIGEAMRRDPRRPDRRRHRRRQRVAADAGRARAPGRRCACCAPIGAGRERARARVPAVRRRPRRLRARRGRRGVRPRIAAACARARRDAALRARRLRDQLRRRAHHPARPGRPGARDARGAARRRPRRGRAIGYLNAHGTATTFGDAAEAESMRRVFGAHGRAGQLDQGDPSATCSAPAARSSCSRRCARSSAARLPPTAHVERVDPAFAIDLVSERARDRRRAAPRDDANSFAFGGTNAVLIASRLAAMSSPRLRRALLLDHVGARRRREAEASARHRHVGLEAA